MFKLFGRKGTAIHTMDLVLLISAVGTAFAIAKGPITKHMAGFLDHHARKLMRHNGEFKSLNDPNEDIEKVTDSSDKSDQVAGYTSQETFYNTKGDGHSMLLAGDLERFLDPAIEAADLDAQYAARPITNKRTSDLQTPDYIVPDDELTEVLTIPVEEIVEPAGAPGGVPD